ncbi:MAG: MFS transporter [Beijerinckiaceae bacterium]
MSQTRPLPPFFEVFRHRNYVLFMVGLGPHAISSWMQRVGVGWLAWELTHSPTWLGLIAAADLVPLLFLSPIAGALTDRIVPVKELRITQWLQFVQAAALAALMVAGKVTIEVLFLLTLAVGCVHAFSTAARHATVPHTVPRNLVATAVSLDSALFQASRFIGPALAAFFIDIYGVAALLIAHAIGTFCFSVMMHFMHVPPPERAKGHRNMIADIKESLHYVRDFHAMGILFLMCLVASVSLRPLQDMMPGFAGAVFSSGPKGLAWLTSAMGVGAMISATWIGVHGRVQGLTTMCYAGLGLLALATLGLVATRNLWVGVVFAAISGYALNTLTTGTQALVQSAVEDSMRARVMSLYTVIFRGTPAIGAFGLGLLAEFIGLRATFAIAAAICAAATLWLLPKRRFVRAEMEKERIHSTLAH